MLCCFKKNCTLIDAHIRLCSPSMLVSCKAAKGERQQKNVIRDSQAPCKTPSLTLWLKKRKKDKAGLASIHEDAVSPSDSIWGPSRGHLELMKGGVFEPFLPHILTVHRSLLGNSLNFPASAESSPWRLECLLFLIAYTTLSGVNPRVWK